MGTPPHPLGSMCSPNCESESVLQGSLQPGGGEQGGAPHLCQGPSQFLNKTKWAALTPRAGPLTPLYAAAPALDRPPAQPTPWTSPGSSRGAWRTQPADSCSILQGGWLGCLGDRERTKGEETDAGGGGHVSLLP